MGKPDIKAEAIGREGHMLVTVDDFVADPHALRSAALTMPFGPAHNHYPGIRAPIPPGYTAEIMPVLRNVFGTIFGRYGDPTTIDISFSQVTTPANALSDEQSAPHCDAYGEDRFALLHYLTDQDLGGTAFFRHRATGFEAITQARAPHYFEHRAIERQQGHADERRYISDTTALFERIALAAPRFNRALIYPGYVLHSGAIPAGARLSASPEAGRLTVTGFFSVAVR